MKLEEIIDVFNVTTNTTLAVVRRSDKASKFAGGIKNQSIELIDYKTNIGIFKTQETSLFDVTEKLERNVLTYIFEALSNPASRVACVNIKDIPQNMTLEEFATKWHLYTKEVPMKIIWIDGEV